MESNTPIEKAENLNETHHTSMGLLLSGLIVLLALVLVGLYLWGASLSEEAVETPSPTAPFMNSEPETPRAATDAQIFETFSPSDDLGAIEADIESTNLDTLGNELDTIERELSPR